MLFDERERLDEEGLSRPGRVVHDARHRAAGIGAHRQHRPTAALRQELLLQVRAQARGELAQPFAGTLAGDRLLAAQRAQPRGRAVAHALGVDRLLDRQGELIESRRDRVRPGRQERQLLALGHERTASLERDPQRQCDREQHLGVEREGACGPRGVLTDVRGRDELGRAQGIEPQRFAGERLTARHEARIAGGFERERKTMSTLEGRLRREHLEHRGKLQHREGASVHTFSVVGPEDDHGSTS